MADTDADYKLVEELLERSFDCPVCLQILSDPCTSVCCKKEFCRACIAKIRKTSGQCPLCRHPTFITRRNDPLGHEVYHIQVYCGNKSKGCDWIGCLGDAEVHLNRKPHERYMLQGCQFVDIPCRYCSNSFKRSEVSHHEGCCPQRPFSCEYCQNYDSYYDDVATNHWPICAFYPVLCSNNCDQYICRQNLLDHITKDCPMTVVECEFKPFGCKERLPRVEMLNHMKYSVAAHESLQRLSKLVKLVKNHEKHLHELETKLHEKYKNLIKEQKILFEKNMASATNEVLGIVKRKIGQLEEIERRFERSIASDANRNRKMESLCQRCENMLNSRREYETRIRHELNFQRAWVHMLNHWLLHLEANIQSIRERIVKAMQVIVVVVIVGMIIIMLLYSAGILPNSHW